MKYALAILVVAITSAGAIYIQQRRVPTHVPTVTSTSASQATLPDISNGRATHRPGWEDPVAVLLGLGGVAAAAGIIIFRQTTVAT